MKCEVHQLENEILSANDEPSCLQVVDYENSFDGICDI